MDKNTQKIKGHLTLKKPMSDLSEDEFKTLVEIMLERINKQTDLIIQLSSIIEVNANNTILLSNNMEEVKNQQNELIKLVNTVTSSSSDMAKILTSLLSKK